MFYDNRLSDPTIKSDLIGARALGNNPLINYEDGGIDISDISQGLQYQVWTGKLFGNSIILTGVNGNSFTANLGEKITEFSFTFDQNMKPVIAYKQNFFMKLYWYNTVISDYQIDVYTTKHTSPMVLLDDKRDFNRSNSDVIFVYINYRYLCMRLQRDRYLIEYKLASRIGLPLLNFGMGKNLRLQFIFN